MLWSFPQNLVAFFWSFTIIVSSAKIFIKLYLLVVLWRKKLSTFSELVLKTTNKSGCFSAKAFLVRGTTMERHPSSYTVSKKLSQNLVPSLSVMTKMRKAKNTTLYWILLLGICSPIKPVKSSFPSLTRSFGSSYITVDPPTSTVRSLQWKDGFNRFSVDMNF